MNCSHNSKALLLQHMRAQTLSDMQEPRGRDITVQDIVFACEICQVTAAELYAIPESSKGLSGVCGEKQNIVTKLWITECAHVVCNRHLEGGGTVVMEQLAMMSILTEFFFRPSRAFPPRGLTSQNELSSMCS